MQQILLKRQVSWSVLIEVVPEKEDECPNNKSELGGAKLPGLYVTKPIGTAGICTKEEESGERGRK